MNKPLQQCMGGGRLPNGCIVRDKCAHYWAPQQIGIPPSERLCLTDEDGEAMTLTPIELERERLSADPRFGTWAAGVEA